MCRTTRHPQRTSIIVRPVDIQPSLTSEKASPAPLFTAIGLLAALFLLWIGRVILLLVFAAIVVAVVITAIVDWLKVKWNLSSRVAFTVILSSATILITLVIWLTGPSIINQFADLQSDLPQAFHQLIARLNAVSWGRWLLAEWTGYSQLSGTINSALTRIGGMVVTTASALVGVVLIGFIGLYLAAEPKLYFSGVQRATPKRYLPTLNACAEAAVTNLRWWVLSQALSMVAVGTIVALGLWLLGVPLPGTLGVIAAVLTFIPNVGPILSVVPAVLLAVAISPAKGLLTILLFLLVHFLEGNIITPFLEWRIVRLPPALTMSAQLLLATIAGPLGLALAAPLTAAALGVFAILFPGQDPAAAPSPTPTPSPDSGSETSRPDHTASPTP